ncbi:condensin complex protein MksE [Alkalimarinus alittae]|uniref:Uncharacterized protein n=1 Tax=Alkalimarinus alittae TaxID=2961619 RepID=A0ABY6N550_9ALTE|nr:hypothetical protein [Alkalimarinus alittae]UZE97235.1 hypothetical protein NKI27_05660 [Alkalimarinus alittae]
MFNQTKSVQIFNELMNGKVINKSILNNSGSRVDNELFVEIMDNLDVYHNQYRMNGYDFVDKSSYVLIRERSGQKEDLKTDATMKVCVLLLLIGKFINEHNYKIGKLTEANGGLTKSDFEDIEKMPDTAELLDKSGLKKGLWVAIKSNLIDRNILLEMPSAGKYILSDAGIAFYDEIQSNYKDQ